jgi:prepilin-type N-terminal cleavage/methylation domain-containing protein
MNIKNFKKSVQSGFTLVELIIVIVILGILAAVAIPKLSDTSTAAYAGVASATQGALKSAWSSAYAVNKGVLPTTPQVAAQMSDPLCPTTTATTIQCTGVTKDGTAANPYTFNTGANAAGFIVSPSTIVIAP